MRMDAKNKERRAVRPNIPESYAPPRDDQAKRGTKARPQQTPGRICARTSRKKNFAVARSTGNAPRVHSFSTAPFSVALTHPAWHNTLETLMKSSTWAGVVAALCLLAPPPSSAGEDAPAPLFRVFLTDGTALVSFGELARVADRGVFSMP